MLCQIERCAKYAEDFYRLLVIDTTCTDFSDDFGHYFVPKAPWIVTVNAELLSRLNTFQTYPHALQGRVGSYTSHFSADKRNFVDNDTDELISFDFTRPYNDNLLIHHACGGGQLSVSCLKRFRLSKTIIDQLSARLAVIGDNYCSIHVRHTDYKTDYLPFFDSLLNTEIRGRILLCSDNKEVIDYGKDLFGPSIYSFSEIPDNGGQPLHHDPSLDKRRVNTDALLDLLMLAKSSKLYAANIDSGGSSGFTLLAANLLQRPNIFESLLGNSQHPAQ